MTNDMKHWFELATSWPVVRRALFYAVVVGAILIAINHGPNLINGQISTTCVLQMVLTVFVPYTVSTLSSVSALLQSERLSDPTNARENLDKP